MSDASDHTTTTTNDLNTLAFAAEEALLWLTTAQNATPAARLPEVLERALWDARSNLKVLSDSLSRMAREQSRDPSKPDSY